MSLRRSSSRFENMLTVGVDYLHSISLNSEQGDQIFNTQRSVPRHPSLRAKSSRVAPVQEVSIDVEADTPTPDHEHQGSVKFASEDDVISNSSSKKEVNPIEESLPLTESRNGNVYFTIFHLLSSGIGTSVLTLPFAFRSLGWGWGITCLTAIFAWQLYTTWLLVNLHQAPTGLRYSRYIQLAMSAFGPTMGKLLALFPVLYLSSGSCVILTINGGLYLKHFYQILCDDGQHCNPTRLSGIEWILIFIVIAIIIAQLPNLNSIAWVSLAAALTAVTFCTLLWLLPVIKGRPSGVSYTPSSGTPTSGHHSETGRVMAAVTAIGMVAFSFRGHNLILEIEGTLPPTETVQKKMWRGVTVAYSIIAVCFLGVAIGGYWAYGTQMTSLGLLTAFMQFHHSKANQAAIYLIIVINSLCQFQIYAMIVFDNFELRYVAIKGEPATGLARTLIRVFMGCFTFFMAITFPFLPKLAYLIGGIALPFTFSYPCFMWNILKKPTKASTRFWVNWFLGCSGVIMGALIIMSSIRNLVVHGLDANFYHPR